MKDELDELSLDPQDWSETRALAHQMLDQVFDDLENVRSRPVWQRLPDAAKASLCVRAPRKPQSLESVYQEFRQNVEPYALGNRNPKFWGWVIGGGTPVGILGDMLASAMNTNAGGFEQSSAYVEKQVIDWFKEVFGFPPEATGLLVTSGSAANLTGLTVGRDAILGNSVEDGIAGRTACVYASEQVHNSVDKAMGVLGLGRSSLRKVRTKADLSMDTDHLRELIAADRSNGLTPIVVIGTAGTVATGAIDDLSTLADICAKENLWLHVDGAFGAIAGLSDRLRSRVKGMERADSLAFDLHKWMSVNYDAGCVLVRNPEAHMKSFSIPASYLSALPGGISMGGYLFSDLGIDLSRGFRALKAWMSIKTYGFDMYARMVEKNVAQAEYLASLVEANDNLELVAPVPLNVVCFRYIAEKLADAELDALNERILVRLQEDGLAVPSGVHVGGKFALRVANVNHRSRKFDFDALAADVVRLGSELNR
ncbi:MAG TPA: pyridoxal-dependent decarboxylase [Gemmatimonadaceae bacterium]|nr:pyridoxal-dependent decarboxylase [Gemmatimonadaceae bacterium]